MKLYRDRGVTEKQGTVGKLDEIVIVQKMIWFINTNFMRWLQRDPFSKDEMAMILLLKYYIVK